MDWVSLAVFIVGCSALDRFRGRETAVAAGVSKVAYGVFVALCLSGWDYQNWHTYAAGALFAAGSAPGWGNPIGAVLTRTEMPANTYQGWQKFKLVQTNVTAALLVRGLIWGAPVALMWFLQPGALQWFVPAVTMPLAFTAAPYLARKFVPAVTDRWAIMEHIRGGVFGALTGVAKAWI